VTATVLVYLDALIPASDGFTTILTWIAVSVAAAATAVRLRLLNGPALPGDAARPDRPLHGSGRAQSSGHVRLAARRCPDDREAAGVLYAIEMLVSRTEGRAVWVRIAVASVLAGLVIRPFIAF